MASRGLYLTPGSRVIAPSDLFYNQRITSIPFWKFRREGNETREWEWSHGEEEAFITDYAASNPYEDFAESAENLVIFGTDGVRWYGRGESLRD